jgi:methyl-accepting chemotaxis protein
MKTKRPHTAIFAVLGVLSLFSVSFAASEEPQSAQAKQIKAMVDKAAALVEKKGKDAFPEFKKKGSEWFKGDAYIIVGDMKGNNLVNAAFPKFEGQNTLDLKDVNDKPITQSFIDLLKTKDSGWVDYMWPKPGETNAAKKFTYLKKAKLGKDLVFVGAGFYPE